MQVEATSILYCVVFPADVLYTINKVIKEKNPLQRIVSARLPAQLHIPRQPQHTARVFEQQACSSQSLLCLVTMGASIQPWQPGPQTTMPMSFFTCFMCQHTHQYDDNTKQYSSCLVSPKITSSQVLNSVSRQRYVVLHFHPSCHLQDCTVFLITVLQLNFAAWQNQGVGAL